ncbi:chemotaxis protein CheA [bacterium]|nr:chemotaxis protein CheA [bacterium]
MGEMDELLKEFLMESTENLDRLDRDFVVLEQDPTNRELLSSIFRAVHTIKGTCGFLGFGNLEKVTHVGENLLGKLRDGKIQLNAPRTSALLSLVDAIRAMLGNIEQTQSDGNADHSELITLLTQLQTDDGAALAPAASAPAPAPEQKQEAAPQETAPAAPQPEAPAPEVKTEAAASVQAVAAKAAPAPAEASHGVSVADTAIRVDVSLLDKLMNLVGELVLSRNQIVQFMSKQEDSNLVSVSQRLNLITSELQEGVMKTRMQPIGNVWSKFPRVVRDLAASCGKKVRLEMIGKETELDKTLIEAMKDPLTHIVRNSVDHGIESPDKRKAAGKNEEGVLSLKAYHEGGQVIIEIVDDGGGIHPDKIKDKAISKGLITPEQAAKMGEREILSLIFLPGFSTAEKVTNVSGRGVGMDVVRTNIERIGGVIDIQSKPGQGTTLRIKVPLTLAIIPALLVTCGGNRYAIPQANLLELVGLNDEEAKTKIETFQGVPVYRLRGKLLPIVYLNQTLKAEAKRGHTLNIVVLQADGQSFGLVVDEVRDTQEIVVKPLGKQLKDLSVFAGATIMGDGCVALILDIVNIAKVSSILDKSRTKAFDEAHHEASAHGNYSEAVLLFRGPDDGRMAIPLSTVSRLEEFPIASVEVSGSTEVIQYRGKIMPLVRVSSVIDERRSHPRNDRPQDLSPMGKNLQVVVYAKGDFVIGFVVDKILDIVYQEVKLENTGSRDGVMGTMVIHSRITEVLDIEELVKLALPKIAAKHQPKTEERANV